MAIIASSAFVNSLVHVIGFLVVLLALTLLWVLTAAIGQYFIRTRAVVTSGAPAKTGTEGGPSEEEVAAIAACIATIMGRRSRIVSIRRERKTDWNREGRRDQLSSHRIR